MAYRSFESFGALKEQVAPAAAAAAGPEEVLRAAADIHADDDATAAKTCRTALHHWVAAQSGGELPPEAAEHRSFAFSEGLRRCEGVRIRNGENDLWALSLRHPDASEAGRFWTTEAAVEVAAAKRPAVRLRLLVNRDRGAADFAPRVPEILGDVASLLELRTLGERIQTDPWLIDSHVAADRLCRTLVDPARRRPVIVLSVPDHAEDDTRPLLDPEALARAVLGLAEVVVLPAGFT